MKTKPATKYLFVTGGVTSSLGKGVLAASIGLLLERRGLTVALQKFDPYLNIDPGTMNPCQHGEVYVLEDGTETDLDLGHYERFCATRLSRRSSVTMGRVYETVLANERRGDYLGQTIQVVPHVVGQARAMIERDDVDVVITEIGGTVGDIEGHPVLEAVRQLIQKVGAGNAAVVHMTLLPYIGAAGELKTKPTQHSVMELRRVGLRPDVLVCRTGTESLAPDERAKLAQFCDVPADRVFEMRDTNPIYAVPLDLFASGFNAAVCARLGYCDDASPECGRVDLSDWEAFVARSRSRATLPVARVVLVGKYDHADAYKSILEALEHAGLAAGVRVDVTMADAEMFDGSGKDAGELENFDGVLVPGGFGARGVAGKINACKAARETKVPYFGICLGLQIAVIECARNLCGLPHADSKEFDPHGVTPVVTILHGQEDAGKGGTMRLGNYPAVPVAGSKLADAYGVADGAVVRERHRHRYEINPAYLNDLAAAGLKVAAVCDTLRWRPPASDALLPIVEAMERTDHPWFVGVQYHPEFNSRPTAPHPLFVAFVKAAACRAASRPTPPALADAGFTVRVRPGEMRLVSGTVPSDSIFAGLATPNKETVQ